MTTKAKRPRYSRRDIEQAATVCSVKSASKFGGRASMLDDIAYSVRASAGGGRRVRDLACRAFSHVFYDDAAQDLSFGEGWAEAESLLRTGWLPDDEGRS